MKYLIGIQPTGKLHIGNYLGCLKKGLELQSQGHDVTFMIANYHSLTTDSFTDITEKELQKLGCKKIVHQTPAYTELFFKLCCKLNLGTLTKMPQYKDKKESVDFDLGLLLYPVLMTADIIINDPDVVIIGRDQVPHLDLCNDISKRIGGKEYKYEFGEVDKVYSLIDATKKMSKSLGENHVLYLFDENYQSKIRRANTNDLGLVNLKLIAKGLGLDPDGYTMNVDLKNDIASKMVEIFQGNV
jgi:tryptophanyl-tRNA synthetase